MDQEYEKHLADVHEQMATPDHVIADAVREATHKDISAKTRLVHGEGNEVYDLELIDGSHVIERISGYEDKDFEQERWAIEQCEKLGIPVPKVLLVNHPILDNKRVDICVQEKLEGDLLERGHTNFRALPEKQLKTIAAQAGELLHRMHTIPTKGFGYLNGKGEGQFNTFTEMMEAEAALDNPDKYMKLADKVGFDRDAMVKIVKVVSNGVRSAPPITPVLTHNDFHPRHILVKDGRVTGLIDFGEVTGNSPVSDFAKWDYCDGDWLPLEWLKEGYADKQVFQGGFEEMVHWMKLEHGLSRLRWYDYRHYAKGVEDAKKKLMTLCI